MTVWIVCQWDCSDKSCVGVYSTKAMAEEMIKKAVLRQDPQSQEMFADKGYCDWEIEAMALDEEFQ